MPRFICRQCGARFPESATPPEACPICRDERQYVRWGGQDWLTPDELGAAHAIDCTEDHGVLGLRIKPAFAIGQRMLLVEADEGNLLWDCIGLVTPEAVAAIKARGPLIGMAISHPHYYTALADWAQALEIPVHLHADDAQWVTEPHPAIKFWNGEALKLGRSLTLLRCGGHFAGATVLHHAKGEGALYCGDVLQVAPDRRYVSVLYSYPNMIPVNAATIRRIAAILDPYPFSRVYGAFEGRVMDGDAKAGVARSFERYLAAIA
ncbi:MBL fold metallo-hydrolase [Bosea sp. (in: a-proteobacteria)]|jgi:hypothetical protein|uniref:MBL fold metallo-hydrolase n=1 Tax=Bosea sp. (in: a-proteobacteria) TaxID=1871050 RepID=UPI003F71FE49